MAERRLYVGNLPFEMDGGKPIEEADLRKTFDKIGKIIDVVVMRDPATRRPRGFAFIEYATEEEAALALSLHGADFHGRDLTVQLANPRRNGMQRREGNDRLNARD